MFHLLEWTSPYDEKEDNASLPTHTHLNLWPVLFQSKLTLTVHAHSNKTTLRCEEFCIFSSVASVSSLFHGITNGAYVLIAWILFVVFS